MFESGLAGIWMPDCRSKLKSPIVFSTTVLPPALGPVRIITFSPLSFRFKGTDSFLPSFFCKTGCRASLR